MKILSIIIPVYNEEKTVCDILNKIENVVLLENIKKELIIINDGSTDRSSIIIDEFKRKNKHLNMNVISHKTNIGKGASIHTGIKEAAGDYIIIQDADLEYEPEEYNSLLNPMINGTADVVFGSRFKGNKPHRILFLWHSTGNKILTLLSNLCTNLNLTDMETCYKMFNASILKSLNLKEKRFGFEPEVTAKISRIPDIRIYEVGISYYGRSYKEGKKINWKDGFRAIFCILKYGLLRMK